MTQSQNYPLQPSGDLSQDDVTTQSSYAPPGTPAAGGGQSTAQAAKEQASDVASGAADSGRHVAQVTKEQAKDVTHEAKNQIRGLMDQSRSELRDQASSQQQRAATGLRSVSDELSSMADRSDNPGIANDLVRQAAQRAGSVASWLEQREPGQLLDEVTQFARRRPGAFLALAAGAGFLVGRLGRSLKDAPDGGVGAQEIDQPSGRFPSHAEEGQARPYADMSQAGASVATPAPAPGFQPTGAQPQYPADATAEPSYYNPPQHQERQPDPYYNQPGAGGSAYRQPPASGGGITP
jgi:hypothetical protein